MGFKLPKGWAIWDSVKPPASNERRAWGRVLCHRCQSGACFKARPSISAPCVTLKTLRKTSKCLSFLVLRFGRELTEKEGGISKKKEQWVARLQSLLRSCTIMWQSFSHSESCNYIYWKIYFFLSYITRARTCLGSELAKSTISPVFTRHLV